MPRSAPSCSWSTARTDRTGWSADETVRRLIENTDDAYGFPPFSLFAPHIRINGDDYAALRKREVELLGGGYRERPDLAP